MNMPGSSVHLSYNNTDLDTEATPQVQKLIKHM